MLSEKYLIELLKDEEKFVKELSKKGEVYKFLREWMIKHPKEVIEIFNYKLKRFCTRQCVAKYKKLKNKKSWIECKDQKDSCHYHK